jgi:hypothetical protein
MEENTIEIYFYDLTKEKQEEIIQAIGNNCNYDIIPIACIPVGEGNENNAVNDETKNELI